MLGAIHALQVLPGVAPGNDLLLEWVRALLPASVALGAIWLMFRQWTSKVKEDTDDIYESIKSIEEHIDDIKETISSMALRNASDHGDVKRDIAKLEERLNNMRSPWELRRNGSREKDA